MKSHKIIHQSNGSALIVVLMCLMGITFLTTAAFYHFTAVSTSMQATAAKQKTFYFADGLRSTLVAISQDYLSNTPHPTEDELKGILANELKTILPSDYTVADLDVNLVVTEMAIPIPSGNFSGMNAPQTRVEFKFTATRNTGTDSSSANYIDAEISLAKISMFQFTYFLDLDYADWTSGTGMQVGGRVHSNGDICLASSGTTVFQQITSAGRIMHAFDPRCRVPFGNGNYTNIYIATGPNFAAPAKLNFTGNTAQSGDNGCTNCDGKSVGWKTYALSRWNGNVQDHDTSGIQPLKLPTPSGVNVQAGADGPDVINVVAKGMNDYFEARSNGGKNPNTRFVVDPELLTDSKEVRAQKFSSQSDIRVIDGIWYLNSGSWPGVPIWSDHPGHFVDTYGKPAGQDDISAHWGWASLPKGFSYYGYDTTSKSILGNPGIISYGSMINNASVLSPGYWIDAGLPTPCSPVGFLPASAATPLQCGGKNVPPAAQFLLSTRSGFSDGHVSMSSLSADSPKLSSAPAHAARDWYLNTYLYYWYSRIVPVNFDLDLFQKALLDKTPGSLGSYFGKGNFMGRPFNGILFITTSWPGSDKGYLNGTAPDYYPPAGLDLPASFANNKDPNQMPLTTLSTADQNTALPFQLCSSSLPATTPMDGTPTGAFFKVPSCNKYGDTTNPANMTSYPNSIRFINGKNILPINFPNGLSLISNISVYVTGDMNIHSDPKDLSSQAGSAGWMPFLVGGDQVTLLSNNWTDANGKWELSTGRITRPATTTTYNMAMITGWARSITSQPLNSLPALNEDWSLAPATMTYNGSIMVGFYPVYYRHGRSYSRWSPNASYTAGPRFINFDEHYNNMANQPPGTPTYNISSVINWQSQ